ncbi:MAG TPA: hypothetical protein VGJ39_11095 [Vicinamibacterales bacterium]
MTITRIIGGAAVAIVGASAWALACGPFLIGLDTVSALAPANTAAYARGSLGVVRPRFARRYLVQGYRVFSGRPPLVTSALPRENPDAPVPAEPGKEWAALSDQILGSSTTWSWQSQWRRLPGTYQQILNCPDSAFALAVRTLQARIQRYGEASAEVAEWTRAQFAVFRNCYGDDLITPQTASASADPLIRADREYQMAAAYFYATQYDEAARRFREIAADATSPWRPYGRYLAARAIIRSATVREENKERVNQLLTSAEAELQGVIADPSTASVHEWARRLLDYLAARIHPIERLHAVSSVLATSPDATSQDFEDYAWLMNWFVGDTVEYPYARVERRSEMVSGDDLTDWVLAMQGDGDEGIDRAVARWQATRATAWLVAVLWRLPGAHPAADAALEAAKAVDRSSPAFATLAFLRVRVLARLGRRGEAKALLATLPATPQPGFDAEALNLLKGERLMLADTLEEFLANAPRTVIVAEPKADQPVMDEDAAVAFNDRFPLDRLVDAAASTTLPRRLRVRVAIAAFTRAVVLQREDAARRIAPVLRQLAPALKADLDRYRMASSAEDRHIAGVFLLLRASGMRPTVQGIDDDVSYEVVDPAMKFDHTFHRNWWCGLDERIRSARIGAASSELAGLLYADRRVPYPVFITAGERTAAEREIQALAAAGAGRSYLGAEALKWARARPADPHVAEALAQTVEGWRFSCGDGEKWDIARQAFTTLHRLFPQSESAKRTKYWYK